MSICAAPTQPISRISFQNDAQDAHDDPSGFSIRTHEIGTGNELEMSVDEKKAMPGRLGLLQTHPPALPGTTPNGCKGNPGA